MNIFQEKARKQNGNPTEDQVKTLRNYGIKPAKTFAGCAQIIRYLVLGNGIQGDTPQQRAAILALYQEKFLERYYNIAGEVYRITEVFPIEQNDAYHTQDMALGGYKYPVAVTLRCDGKYEMRVSLSMLLLAKHQ